MWSLLPQESTRQRVPSVGRVASVISEEQTAPLDSRSCLGQLQTHRENELGTQVEAAALVLYPFLAAPGCLRAKCFTSKPGSLRARETPLGEDGLQQEPGMWRENKV